MATIIKRLMEALQRRRLATIPYLIGMAITADLSNTIERKAAGLAADAVEALLDNDQPRINRMLAEVETLGREGV